MTLPEWSLTSPQKKRATFTGGSTQLKHYLLLEIRKEASLYARGSSFSTAGSAFCDAKYASYSAFTFARFALRAS